MKMTKKRFSLIMASALILMSGCANNKANQYPNNNLRHEKSQSSLTNSTDYSDDLYSEDMVESSAADNPSVFTPRDKKYNVEEKLAITNEFLEWASERAAIGGMAVNTSFFNHGASGKGDWYALTPERDYILVQQQAPNIRETEFDYFSEAIGGIVFYYSIHGTTGKTDEINHPENRPGTAVGFSHIADLEKPIIKYLLTDHGMVYEFNSNGAFSDGFYVTDDEGDFNYWPAEQIPFKASEDEAAIREFQRILSQYN